MKTLILFELKKIFSRRLSQAAFVLVLLLSGLFTFSTYHNKFACDGNGREGTGRTAVEIDKAIAKKYEGELTDAKVKEMLSDLIPKGDFHGLNVKYVYQNAMQSAVAARFSDADGNWNGLRVSDVFGGEKIMIGYNDGWLSTSQDMVQIIVVLVLAAIVVTTPVFSGEYSGVDQIILTSRYGRSKCSAAKVAAAILTVFLMTAITIMLHLMWAFLLYGKEGLSCSILFAQLTFSERFIPFNITCGTLLGYQVFLAFTGVMGAAGFTLLLSAICRNQMTTVVASVSFFVLPMLLPVSETSFLFKLVVLLPVYHAQFVSLMGAGQIQGQLLYAVWALPVAALFFGAGSIGGRKIFACHQVS